MYSKGRVRDVVAAVMTAAGVPLIGGARRTLDFCLEQPLPVDELRAARAAIDGEIARRSEEGCVVLAEGGVRAADAPPGGAVLVVSWCTSEGESRTWHPSVDGAKAALLKLADANQRTPSDDGMALDLTCQGCLPSSAWVVDRTAG